MTKIAHASAVLPLLAMTLACSGPIRVAPRWRVEVRESGRPVPGVTAVESWRHRDCEAVGHTATAVTDERGVVEFPERMLDRANCKEPFAEGRRQSVREVVEHGPHVDVLISVRQPRDQFPPLIELPPPGRDGVSFTSIELEPGWTHIAPYREEPR